MLYIYILRHNLIFLNPLGINNIKLYIAVPQQGW